MISEQPRTMPEDRFVARLEALAARDDRASLARLKRCAGRRIAESGSVMRLFYQLLPGSIHPRAEEDYFLIATLFPMATRRGTGDLGRSLRILRWRLAESQHDGIDRRVALLLDSSRAELSFRLRQVIRQVARHELPLDWRQILRDIQFWDHPERWVQKRWARSYFGGMSEAPPSSTDGSPGDGENA
jgi:CRISPR system Cascade subunit CasB